MQSTDVTAETSELVLLHAAAQPKSPICHTLKNKNFSSGTPFMCLVIRLPCVPDADVGRLVIEHDGIVRTAGQVTQQYAAPYIAAFTDCKCQLELCEPGVAAFVVYTICSINVRSEFDSFI